MAWTDEQLDDALEAQFSEPKPLVVAARKLDPVTFDGITAAEAIASADRLVTASRIEEARVPARRPPVTNENYWMLRTYQVVGG